MLATHCPYPQSSGEKHTDRFPVSVAHCWGLKCRPVGTHQGGSECLRTYESAGMGPFTERGKL